MAGFWETPNRAFPKAPPRLPRDNTVTPFANYNPPHRRQQQSHPHTSRKRNSKSVGFPDNPRGPASSRVPKEAPAQKAGRAPLVVGTPGVQPWDTEQR